MNVASCPDISILIDASLSFCLTKESELAASASDNAMEWRGFVGNAEHEQHVGMYLNSMVQIVRTFRQPFRVFSIVTQDNDVCDLSNSLFSNVNHFRRRSLTWFSTTLAAHSANTSKISSFKGELLDIDEE